MLSLEMVVAMSLRLVRLLGNEFVFGSCSVTYHMRSVKNYLLNLKITMKMFLRQLSSEQYSGILNFIIYSNLCSLLNSQLYPIAKWVHLYIFRFCLKICINLNKEHKNSMWQQRQKTWKTQSYVAFKNTIWSSKMHIETTTKKYFIFANEIISFLFTHPWA